MYHPKSYYTSRRIRRIDEISDKIVIDDNSNGNYEDSMTKSLGMR